MKEAVMKKLFTVLMVGFLFILVSCDGGTKKDTDKDSGTSDKDVIADNEITDDDFPSTDHDSPVTDEDPPLTDDDLPLTDDDEDSDDDRFTVEGFVQKGPFIKDSIIKVTELDHNFEMIPATSFTTQTIDDLGNFKIKRKFNSRYILLEATGFYYNEVEGSVSSTQITNFVFVDLKANNSKVSINILTTLARRRIQYLMKNGKNFNEARTQAETEILGVFGIFGETAASFQDMDILKAGNSNAMLLAISSRLQGSNTPGQLSVLTAGIIYDIEETGLLSDSSLKDKIVEGSKHISTKLPEIRDNLEAYFGSKVTVDVPNFEDYCDDNGNGVINKWEFDLDFATVSNADLTTEYLSEEKLIKINPGLSTTAFAIADSGIIIKNGLNTGLKKVSVEDGDKIAIKSISSDEKNETVKTNVVVEVTVTDGKMDDWTVEGSFFVNTVPKDPETGLSWSFKSSGEMNWEEAITYCDNLNESGNSDWRLPTIGELKTIINLEPISYEWFCNVSDSCLEWSCRGDGHLGECGTDPYNLTSSLFGDTETFCSSSLVSDKEAFWGIHFIMASIQGYIKNGGYFVRCVR
jgi:hypothetical protein